MTIRIAPDLRKVYPRSPREQMADLVWVPRMVDKARAACRDRLGDYLFPCPMDQMLLDFLGVEASEFQKAVQRPDSEIESWLKEKLNKISPKKRQEFNQSILNKQPDSPDKWDKFNRLRKKIDPARTDITTWAGLIDLEEGRI